MRFKRPGEVLERSSKKSRKDSTMVVYRGLKPEMKHEAVAILLSAATSSDFLVNSIAQGTNSDNRIGNKIKVHHIEGFFESNGTVPIRMDLYVPNIATSVASHVYNGAMNRDSQWLLKNLVMLNGASPNLGGHFFSHKLPLGLVCKYNNTTASSVVDNAIRLRITSPAAATGAGYIRIWYTDA